MKKTFRLKRIKTKNKRLIIAFCFFVVLYGVFKIIDHSTSAFHNEQIVTYLLKPFSTPKENNSLLELSQKFLLNIYNQPAEQLLTARSNLIKKKDAEVKPVVKEEASSSPLIYIYNTHQSEEYAPTTFLEYSAKPTVMISNYILEDTFNSNNYKTIVEESKIKDILTQNNWKYSYSYKASRIFLEQQKQAHPSLKYFIDVHRDSLTKDRTTITLNGKDYAKVMFIIGLENPTYEQNLAFTTSINNCLNQKYPSLSKGIYKKQGAGVDGVYNQDFSPYTILIEMGGYENTITEVMNSSLAFATCFMEVIQGNESQTTQ